MLDSTTKKTFALLRTPRQSAKENMSIDKELFKEFTSSQKPVFRVYAWEESFTYGVSQKIDTLTNFDDLQSYGDNHAQRMTGGGILFHGNDISYSLIIPTAYVTQLSVKESYELICSFLMNFYKSLGLSPSYAKDISSIELSKSAYCQQGYEPYDILIDGKKIGGNAQRRTKEAIFQHGSVSIESSADAHGHALQDFGINLEYAETKDLLIKSFADTFNVEFEEKKEERRHAS
jgi:lipoate-protein ligase A